MNQPSSPEVVDDDGDQLAAQLAGHRRGRYPAFFALVDKYDLQTGDIDFEQNPTDDSGAGRDPLNTEKLIAERPAAQANSFSSRIRRIPVPESLRPLRARIVKEGQSVDQREPTHDERHLPIFDIDHPCVLIPSTTEGHYHLIIDRPMSQSNYLLLMDTMVTVGLVQEGYARAARKRTAAWLRTPWTRK